MIWRILLGLDSPLLVRLLPSTQAEQIIDKSQVRITGTTARVVMCVPPVFNIPLTPN
jgi:hypothetical protein